MHEDRNPSARRPDLRPDHEVPQIPEVVECTCCGRHTLTTTNPDDRCEGCARYFSGASDAEREVSIEAVEAALRVALDNGWERRDLLHAVTTSEALSVDGGREARDAIQCALTHWIDQLAASSRWRFAFIRARLALLRAA